MGTGRRLVAVLAADVVGYSRLMGEDESGTAKSVREHREALMPIIRGLGGRLVKTTGDGVLLEFSSIIAAVECAIAMQKQLAERNIGVSEGRRILYRIGVNLGDVLIEGRDILGDGVNVAARLEGIAEPGGICISGSAYDQVRGRIDAEFVDLGERVLKNIARPVRVYALRAVEAVPSAPRSAPGENSGPPRLSIVVLPLTNIGGGEELDYFVEGVTESLTTDLSRMSGAFVIGRSTAFTYKDKAVDLKQIGHELNVRYLLEGSVQRSGNRLRVNVQLINAMTGDHLWAERFDKAIADLFEMQDEIIARLANQLEAQLIGAEALRVERTRNPDSLDLYFQGMAWFNKGVNPQFITQARAFYERALLLDSNNVAALVGIGLADLSLGTAYFEDHPDERLRAAESALGKALSLAPGSALAHYGLGALLASTNRATLGIAELEHALVLDPNLARAHAYIGLAKAYAGRAEEAEAHVFEALRLSPRDPLAFMWFAIAGSAKTTLGEYEQALSWLRRSIEANRNSPLPRFYNAAALAQLGRLEEARAEVQAGLALDPKFTIKRYRAGAKSDNPTYLARLEHICEGLRKSGLDER
jgi:TolB-like protein/class 3 adenylate cyclase/Tfp pilus assembly protein PilF